MKALRIKLNIGQFYIILIVRFPSLGSKKKGANWPELKHDTTQKCVNVNNRQVAAISGTISEWWKVFNSLKCVSDEQSVKNKISCLHIYTPIKTKNLISTAEITVLQIPNPWKPGKRTP